MKTLVAPPFKLEATYADRFQLQLPRSARLLEVGLMDALMIRLAQYAATPSELLLRCAEVGHCSPAEAEPSLQRGLQQGWLSPLTDGVRAPSWLKCPGFEGAQWVHRGAEPMRLGSSTHILLCAKYLGALDAEDPPPLREAISMEAWLRSTLPSWSTAADISLLGSGSWLRSLEEGPWLGVAFCTPHPGQAPLPGPVISDAAAWQAEWPLALLPGLLCPAGPQAWGEALGALLALLYPGGKLLYLPAMPQSADSALDGVTALAARLLMRLPTAECLDLSPDHRCKSLLQKLQQWSLSSDQALQTKLSQQWLLDWQAEQDWMAAYGLEEAEGASQPRFDRTTVEAVREHLLQWIEHLSAPWSTVVSA